MTVAVFGLGYVGSITASCLAVAGHRVIGIDPDRGKVAAINEGRAPVGEPGLAELVAEARSRGRLTASTETGAAAEAAVSLMCVSTPSRPNGSVDLSYLGRAAASLGAILSKGSGVHVVLVRSTVPPGTIEGLVVPRLVASGLRPGVDFAAGSFPEFLREGKAVADFYDPPSLVMGTSDQRVAATARRLMSFLPRPVTVTDTRSAELLKYACNAFRALKVVFANEVGLIARASGADAREVMRLFCDDPRLNLTPNHLRPGFAFGGPCLPKDLRGLVSHARSVDLDAPVLSTITVSNEEHVRRAVNAVLATGHRTVGLLGLSFKPGTDDLRDSPPVELAERLIGKGLDVRIYDASVHPEKLYGRNRAFVEEHLPHLGRLLFDTPLGALEGAGCAVVATTEAPVVEALLTARPASIIDLEGTVGAAVEALPGYQGIAW